MVSIDANVLGALIGGSIVGFIMLAMLAVAVIRRNDPWL